MIAIFKTNVAKTNDAKSIVKRLQELFPNAIVNFDLKDCDRILRVENQVQDVEIKGIIDLLQERGHLCEELND